MERPIRRFGTGRVTTAPIIVPTNTTALRIGMPLRVLLCLDQPLTESLEHDTEPLVLHDWFTRADARLEVSDQHTCVVTAETRHGHPLRRHTR